MKGRRLILVWCSSLVCVFLITFTTRKKTEHMCSVSSGSLQFHKLKVKYKPGANWRNIHLGRC